MATPREVRAVDRAFASSRLEDARAFRRQADLTAELDVSPAGRKAAASSAILAGIAGGDAACGFALGEVWKGDHNQAHTLIAGVTGGREAGTSLKRLVASKTDWQYLTKSVPQAKLDAALRHADKVIEFAEQIHSGRR